MERRKAQSALREWRAANEAEQRAFESAERGP